MMTIKDIRRENMLALAKSIGGITPMANRLDKSQSQISHLIGSKPIKKIGDKIAAQIEQAFNKPRGWMDVRHTHLQESTSSYENNKVNLLTSHHVVPLLAWDMVKNWAETSDHYQPRSKEDLIPTLTVTGLQAFALRVVGDSMEAANGPSFCDGAIIIVDPDYTLTSGAFVVCGVDREKSPLFKQFIRDGDQCYLKPLNPRYPLIRLDASFKLYGVVRQLLMQF